MNFKIIGLVGFLIAIVAYYFLFINDEVKVLSKSKTIVKQETQNRPAVEEKRLLALKAKEEQERSEQLKAETREKAQAEVQAQEKVQAEAKAQEEAEAQAKAQELARQKEEEQRLLAAKTTHKKELQKSVNHDTYSKVYDENGLNIFMDDYIIGEISKEKLEYVVKRVALNIGDATVTIKKGKNNEAYMEITKYTQELNVDNNEHLSQIEFDNNKHTYNFAYDKSNLPNNQKVEEFFSDLDYAIKETNVKKIVIVGHTDSKGDDNYNLFLSYRRANALSTRLNKYDIDTNFIAKGETEPIASNKTQEGRAANRRIEIRLYGDYNK